MQSKTAFGAVIDIFLSPTKAFSGLKEAKGWSWMAFALVMVFFSASQYSFYSSADPQYLVEQQMAMLSPDLSIDERKATESYMKQGAEYSVWVAIGGGIVGFIIINAIMALYYSLISKMDLQSNSTYGAWYGFGFWTMMPMVINFFGVIILVVTAGTDQLPLTLQNFASLNQLVLGLEPADKLYALTESLNIFNIWGIVLTAIGLKVWTNFSTNKASLFACLPFIVIYLVWFVIALA
ncbi:MAG: YIP1 family protein [Parashewanella sp.]